MQKILIVEDELLLIRLWTISFPWRILNSDLPTEQALS